METSFGEIKKKEVVNLADGKQLGKVCDLVFAYPEGKVLGLVVPGGKGFRFGKCDLFIDLKKVCKIGVDVILVDIKCAPKPSGKKQKWEGGYPPEPPPPMPRDRRDYGEYE